MCIHSDGTKQRKIKSQPKEVGDPYSGGCGSWAVGANLDRDMLQNYNSSQQNTTVQGKQNKWKSKMLGLPLTLSDNKKSES